MGLKTFKPYTKSTRGTILVWSARWDVRSKGAQAPDSNRKSSKKTKTGAC